LGPPLLAIDLVVGFPVVDYDMCWRFYDLATGIVGQIDAGQVNSLD
jgi:hypothetical protein